MISLVVPVYNEASGLRLLYDQVVAASVEWGDNFELLLVDDGSTDESFAIARTLAQADHRVRVINFTRNFGHQAAVSAGLFYAAGDPVVVMDADLQDPPEVLATFLKKMGEVYDVVYAVRTRRKEWWLKRAAYALFYRLLGRLASIPIPLDAGDFSVMSRAVVDSLNALPERNRFVRGLRTWVGYRQTGLAYERAARAAGAPKYTMPKLVNLALDGMISFSFRPLRALSLLGMGLGLLSLLLAAVFVVQYVTDTTILGHNPRQVRGWSSLIVSVFFLSGVQLFGLGVLGEYLGRVFDEAKRRPVYLVRETVNLPVNPGPKV